MEVNLANMVIVLWGLVYCFVGFWKKVQKTDQKALDGRYILSAEQ